MNEYIELYKLATEIQELEPWNYLLDFDKLLLDDEGQMVLFSVLGSGGFFRGIVVYEGLRNIYEFQKFSETQIDLALEHHYVINQNYLLCRFVKKEDLNPFDCNYYQTQNINLDDENLYPSFVNHRRGYLPQELEESEIKKMMGYLYHFKQIMLDLLEQRLNVDLENNDFILRKYSREKNKWTNEVGNDFRVVSPRYKPQTLSKIKLEKIKKLTSYNNQITLDYRFLDSPVVSNELSGAHFPLLIVAFDNKLSKVIKTKLCTPEDDILEASFLLLMEVIKTYGKPRQMVVYHEELYHHLVEVCFELNIALSQSLKCEETNNFFNELNQFSHFKTNLNFKDNQIT